MIPFVSLLNDLQVGLMMKKYIKETRNINEITILCGVY